MLGGIEAGGTKFVCAVGREDGTIIDRIEFPTKMPDETIEKVIQYFRQFSLQAIGIGSFGPVDNDKTSQTYGTIMATPKAGWRHYPFLQTVKNEMKIPVGFSTDVNAAALGEFLFGEAKGLDSCLYITIGTGIGAGAIVGAGSFRGCRTQRWAIFISGGTRMTHTKGSVLIMEIALKAWLPVPPLKRAGEKSRGFIRYSTSLGTGRVLYCPSTGSVYFDPCT